MRRRRVAWAALAVAAAPVTRSVGADLASHRALIAKLEAELPPQRSELAELEAFEAKITARLKVTRGPAAFQLLSKQAEMRMAIDEKKAAIAKAEAAVARGKRVLGETLETIRKADETIAAAKKTAARLGQVSTRVGAAAAKLPGGDPSPRATTPGRGRAAPGAPLHPDIRRALAAPAGTPATRPPAPPRPARGASGGPAPGIPGRRSYRERLAALREKHADLGSNSQARAKGFESTLSESFRFGDLASARREFSAGNLAARAALRARAGEAGAAESLRLRAEMLRGPPRAPYTGLAAPAPAWAAPVVDAARRGDPEAQSILGACFAKGRAGFPSNREAAVSWIDAAAAQGHEAAVKMRAALR